MGNALLYLRDFPILESGVKNPIYGISGTEMLSQEANQ